MAGELKQIYQLNNGIFNGSSLVPFEVPNTDPLTSAEKPYITRKTTGDAVSEFVAKTQEFETDLQTDDKTIIGAINELKEGGGGNANYVELTQAEYDELTEEEKHNGKMYFITDGGSDGSIIDDETISTETTWSSQKINDELSGKADLSLLSDIKRIDTEVTNQSCAANACTVVHYTITVPTGYKVIGGYDSSYFANLIATPISLRDDGNMYFNYFSTAAFSNRTLKATIILAKNIKR